MDDVTHSDASDQDPDGGVDRMLGLTREVRSLHDELSALRDALATEVRTRRIVVVEADGFERCIVDAAGTHAVITLAGRSEPGLSTAMDFYVDDAMDGDGPSVGLALIDRGNVVASFGLVSPQSPRVWIDDGGDTKE